MSNRKIILLTGASSGIGEATARRLVQAGHHLVIGARRIERLQTLRDELGNIDCLAIDVTQAEDLAKMAQFALQQHGRIDVLINNAGVMPLSPLAALKMEEWRQTIDVNVHGVLNGIAAVLPTMQQQRAGRSSTLPLLARMRSFRSPPCIAPASLLFARSPTGCARRATIFASR